MFQANEFNANPWVDEKEIPYAQAANAPYNRVRVRLVGGRSLFWARQSFRLSDFEFKARDNDCFRENWPIQHDDWAPFYSQVEAHFRVVGRKEGWPEFPDGNFVDGNRDSGDLYLLDRRTGVERQLTDTPEWESYPRISPDGLSVIYKWFLNPGRVQSRRLHLQSGAIETICDPCTFMDQTPDGKSFLYGDQAALRILVRDFAGGGQATEPVHDETIPLVNASLDASGRGLAFVAVMPGEEEYRIFVAPYRRDGIAMGTGMTPLRSPNGEWLYFDDGNGVTRRLLAQRFEPKSGRRVGERIEIAKVGGISAW